MATTTAKPAAAERASRTPHPGVYRRRRPERTLAYQVVQGWLATWLAQSEEAEPDSVAAYVERELRGYLECGILAHGFARARCPDCAADFLVAFSCKGRGVCPSCTTKRMTAIAAHLVEAVIPRVPMRQWVLALPRRLRPALRADPALATRVLRVFIDAIERALRQCCAAPSGSRLGAVSFVQRFGSALNEHWHYHCCVSDGVFAQASDGRLEFVPAEVDTQTVTAAVQARVRRRVLAAYRRRGWLDAEAAEDMAGWDHGGGFSVDGSVGIHGNDRAGLERLLRYCARPCWSSQRLTQAGDGERLIYLLPKPALDGSRQIVLTPLELLDRLARFIPPPRRHLHRYHGVFAPHAKLRAQVAERAGQPVVSTNAPPTPEDLAEVIRQGLGLLGLSPHNFGPLPEPAAALPGARSWARLIARIYEVDPLRCRHCGAPMRWVAFIVERAVIVRILEHLGEPTHAPRAAPIRDPPPSRWASRRGASTRAEAHPPEPAFDAPGSSPGQALFLDPMPDDENQRQDLGW